MTHTSTEQPEALRLADEFDNAMAALHQISIGHSMSNELRRLHARVQEMEAERAAIIAEKNEYKYALRHAQNELEAQLSAIGAGGVEPLRKLASVTASERELFEAVASDSGKWPKAIERDAKGNYLLLTTANGWMWWREARAALAATPEAAPENIRDGAPYDNPAFEQLARDMGVWGTAQAALCAQFWLAAAQPSAQGMDAQLVAFIEKVRDFKVQAVRVGSKEGEIRWDIEFGHYGAELRGKTLREAITKALAAQAKHGEAQQ